jgi:hypothetical protein
MLISHGTHVAVRLAHRSALKHSPARGIIAALVRAEVSPLCSFRFRSFCLTLDGRTFR